MANRYNFDCGLPRAGTTLISTLISQHPEIDAGPATPICDIMENAKGLLFFNNSYAIGDEQRSTEVIKGIIETYYADSGKAIILDKSRFWLRNPSLIFNYVESQPRIICAVRNPLSILASFIIKVEESPNQNFVDRTLLLNGFEINHENRCSVLMDQGGMMYDCLNWLYRAVHSPLKDNILLVDYNSLVSDTQAQLNNVTRFLGAKPYSFDLANIESKEDTEHVDKGLGLKDMHKVHPKIQQSETDYKEVLSQAMINKYEGLDFWNTQMGIQ